MLEDVEILVNFTIKAVAKHTHSSMLVNVTLIAMRGFPGPQRRNLQEYSIKFVILRSFNRTHLQNAVKIALQISEPARRGEFCNRKQKRELDNVVSDFLGFMYYSLRIIGNVHCTFGC